MIVTAPLRRMARLDALLATSACLVLPALLLLLLPPARRALHRLRARLRARPAARVRLWGPRLPGAHKWLGGALDARHAAILGVPSNAEHVIRLDLRTGATALLPGPKMVGRYKWLRGVRAADGTVFCIPACADGVLRISAEGDVAIIGAGELPKGEWMWHGGQLGRDGMIYAIPANADRVLRIDPSRNEVALIGPVLHHGVRSKWYGGITANDGSIWGMPYNAPSALKITPPAAAGVAEAQIVEVGEFPLGGWKWHGGTRSGEYVIGIPSHASAVLRIHAETNQVALLGAELEVMQGKYKWGGATTDHNGIVWAIPSDADVPLRIVPSTGEVSVVADGVIASAIGPEWKNKWQGGVLGADGDVYCIPCDAQQVLAIHTESGTVSLLGNLPAGKKKFQGGALAPDGTIWGLPESCEHILRITPPLRPRTHT